MGEKMTLTDAEIKWLLTSPAALRAVADYNDFQESQADSMGMPCSTHRERRIAFNAEAKRIEAEWDAEREPEQRVFFPDAHLTQPAQAFGPSTNEGTNCVNPGAAPIVAPENAQPAQAVDVGAEDRFEQYVKTLIDKAPDVQKLGERLAHWLDDDQFNNIEPILLGIARQLAALPNANGKEG